MPRVLHVPLSKAPLVALTLTLTLAVGSASIASAQPAFVDVPRHGVLDAAPRTTASELAPPSGSDATRSGVLGARQRLTLWDIERHRAELERLWDEVPSFTGPLTLVGMGGGLAFGAFLDFSRRGFRALFSGWGDDDDDGERDSITHSPAAAVIGAMGAGLVLTGLLLWGQRARERRHMVREIRRLEGLLGYDPS